MPAQNALHLEHCRASIWVSYGMTIASSLKAFICCECTAHLLSEGRPLPSRHAVSSRHSARPLRESAAAACSAGACAGA